MLCVAAGLLLTACERHDTSTPQGAADAAADNIRSAGRDASDRARDTLRDATNGSASKEFKRGASDAANKIGDAVKDAGKSLENAGEKLKEKSQ